MKKKLSLWPIATLLSLSLMTTTGCIKPPTSTATEPGKSAHGDQHHHEDGHDHEEAPMGGVAIPAGVRDNLGITFAKVESRAVAATRRVPGQFELLPTARQEHRALLGGRVKLEVKQLQAVNAGDVLFTIDSPQWRQMQHEAVEAEGEIIMAQAAVEVARAHRAEASTSLTKQEERIQNLTAVKVRKAELESSATALRSSLPRLDAELRAQEAALREAQEHYESRLSALSSVTGLSIDDLRRQENGVAAWHNITLLPVRAQQPGVVETLVVNDGGWLEQGDLALTVIAPEQIRFHAEAPQADLAIFRDGQRATVFLPQSEDASISGLLTLGLTANQEDRTLSLYVTPDTLAPWAKAGVGAYLEVTLSDQAPKQLAIPSAAVIQDGLEHVFYRRDPKNPDRAMRVVADLGDTDGRWVVLRSGVKEGDEVVLDGVYALKLSSATQQTPAGYHYHADGSLHKDH